MNGQDRRQEWGPILADNLKAIEALKQHQLALSFSMLKQLERTLEDKREAEPHDPQLMQLQSVTFNNIACFYKKTNKPKSALIYLRKALVLEDLENGDMSSIAQLYINICAILSQLGQHALAKEHAETAISLLQAAAEKVPGEQRRAIHHIEVVCCFNLASEFEHLREYDKVLAVCERGLKLATDWVSKQVSLIAKLTHLRARAAEQLQSLQQRSLVAIRRRKMGVEFNSRYDASFNEQNVLPRSALKSGGQRVGRFRIRSLAQTKKMKTLDH